MTRKILTIVIIVLASCTEKEKISLGSNAVKFNSFKDEGVLILDNFLEYNSITPLNYTILDSSLFLMDISQKSDKIIHELNLHNNSLKKTHFSRGNGPNEFISPISTGIYDNLLWGYDFTTNKIIQSKLDSDSLQLSEISLNDLHGWLARLDSTLYLSTGNREHPFKVQVIDASTGNITDNFGQYYNIPPNLPIEIVKQIFQCILYVKPDMEKAVSLYRFTDSIEIFNLQNHKSKVITGPEVFEVEFDPIISGNQHFMNKTEDTRQAFIYGSVTNEYIYALYSGEPALNPASQLGNLIYVYDWEGNPVKKITLNKEIMSFIISPNNTTVYSYDINSGMILKGTLQ